MTMRSNWPVRVLKFAVIAALALLVFGFVVMSLWNWLMPGLFGLRQITFWQALAMVILCKILFGGLHRHGGPSKYWKRRMIERWEQMTPEEREKFREGMRGRCGSFRSPEADQKG